MNLTAWDQGWRNNFRGISILYHKGRGSSEERVINTYFTEFVLDDRDALAVLLREDVVQEGRFPAPEEAGQDRDGDLRHREPAHGAFVHEPQREAVARSPA